MFGISIYVLTLTLLFVLLFITFHYRKISDVLKYFYLTVLIITYWIACNFIGDTTSVDSTSDLAIRLSHLLIVYIPIPLFYFFALQNQKFNDPKWLKRFLFGASTFFAIVGFSTNLIFSEIVAGPPADITKLGIVYPLYISYVYVTIFAGMLVLWRGIKNNTVKYLTSAKISLYAILFAAVINLIFTAGMDLLDWHSGLFYISVASIGLMCLVFFYALYNGQLFEVRKEIYKQIVYLFSYLLSISLFLSVVLIVSTPFVSMSSESLSVNWLILPPLVINLAIALIIYLQDKENLLNISFAFFILFFSIWGLVKDFAYSISTDDEVLVFVRFIFFFGMMFFGWFTIFIDRYSNKNLFSNLRLLSAYILLWIVAELIALSSLGIVSTEVVNDIALPVFTPLMILVWLFIISSTYICAICVREVLRLKRKQVSIILLLTFIMLAIIPVFDVVIIKIFGSSEIIEYGFIYQWILVVLCSFVVFKKEFLKVSTLLVRNVMYTLAIFTLVVLVILVITTLRVGNDSSNQFVNALLISALSVGFGALLVISKKQFDTLTNRIFFQGQYDTAKVLDQLADVLVSQGDIDNLLENTLEVYSGAIKPSFSFSAAISKKEIVAEQRMNSADIRLSQNDLKQINPEWKVKRVSQLPDSKIKDKFMKNDIEVLSTTAINKKLNGIFLFGPKQTGTPYTKQDIDLLDTSGKNLSISIQNASRLRLITNFNTRLKQEIDTATEKLKQTNTKLRELDRSKDEFMSMVSHQLRTPLTAVKNLTLLLNEGKFGELKEPQRRAVMKSYQSTEQMVNLIEELLNISRINSGSFTINKTKNSLTELVERIVEQFDQIALSNNIKIKLKRPKTDKQFEFDETKIREVIINFLDNAIHYSGAGSTVNIELSFTSTDATVKVIDSGIGVPEDEQKKVFSKFFRTKHAKNSRPDGTGLGLFLAQKVVDAHDGKIIFESTPGKGSTFGFKIPANG